MSADKKIMETNNNNLSNDEVLAHLTYEFGDDIQSDVIFNVCTKFDWNFDSCNENLKKLRNQEIGAKIRTENDSEVILSTAMYLNKLEQGPKNVVTDAKKSLDTFAGVIKKTNQKASNLMNLDEFTSHPSQPKRFEAIKDRSQIQKVCNDIMAGIKLMVIMRGVPGCGKSHLAREIIDATTQDDYSDHIFSSDDFFYDRHGNYNFSASRLEEVHDSNKKRVDMFARSSWSPIIVDNTNIKIWEMRNYLEIAVRYGYLVEIVEPNTKWSESAGKLAMKNSHGVSKETIERMLSNYEPVENAAAVMAGFRLNYTMPMPQYRQFPLINKNAIEANQQLTPKPQRTSNRSEHSPKSKNFRVSSQVPDVVQYESLSEAFQDVGKADEWVPFEKAQTKFWSNNNVEFPQPPQIHPKQQRTPKQSSAPNTLNEVHSNIFTVLKERNENIVNNSTLDEVPKPALLQKHRKNCRNENKLFGMIREIYPSVSLDILWDLFEKCEGDADWTIDILLKEETRIADYDNVSRAENDFKCDCDWAKEWAVPVSVEAAPTINTSTYQRSRLDRNAINYEEKLAAKRLIEESVQIGDEHYSNHTRKIRNFRHGVTSPATVTVPECEDEEGAYAIDVDCSDPSEEEELIEINLGIELVCQLDSVLGVEAYQKDALANMTTTVFMPKSTAIQLYALWMESMHNQQEEQRIQSIKEDAEFARQTQSQENYPGLHKHAKPPSNLKDIMEMEYALTAYKAEIDEWKQETPQDLALQMSHNKLCDIFPNIDRNTLIEVLAAHNNNFSETVDVLKDTLGSAPENKLLNKGKQLFYDARAVAEMSAKDFPSSRPESDRSMEMRKLGLEEAKHCALKEFEDNRNLGIRHNELKRECYSKANEAIRQGNPSVAQYYSQVASLHKTKADSYNQKAANCMVRAHDLSQNNPDTLDLHYLHVNEAAECLDLFLDKHIDKLKSKRQSYKYLLVITGRGLHSVGGISTIKQKVKSRFNERNLTWSEMNPGLLRVKIFGNSRLSQFTS